MKRIYTLVYVALLLATTQNLLGQNQKDNDKTLVFKESLEELMRLPVAKSLFDVKITTASLNEELSGQALAMTRVITAEQIRVRGYQSLKDVLQDLPDFKVDELIDEQTYNAITTRGIVGQEKFIILLDGVRISSPTNETMPIVENYPVNFAKQIEVVYGSASAIYGADALSGVINIITKKPNKDFTLEFAPSVGSYGLYSGDLFVHKKMGKASLTIAGKYFQEQQPDMSQIYPDEPGFDMTGHQTGVFNTIFGPQTALTPVNPDFSSPRQAYAIYGSLAIEDFQLNLFTNYARHSTSINATTSNAVYNDDVFYGQSILMSSLNYSKKLRNVSFSSSIMGSIYELDPRSNYRNTFVGMGTGYKYAIGNEIKINQVVNWQFNRQLNLIGGFTLEFFSSTPKSADLVNPIDKRQSVEGQIAGTDLDAEFFQVNYNNLGGFIQLQYTPTPSLNFTVGNRYDYNTRFGSTFNPRLGIVVQPSPKLTLKAMYGSSFLAPSPLRTFEHYGTFFSNDGGQTYQSFFWHLPNPDLKPIRSQNLEAGVRYFISEAFSINLHGYYLWLSDLINNKPDNGNIYNNTFLGWPVDFIEVPVNEGSQINYGGTLQLDYRKTFKTIQFNSYLAFSYVDGRVDILGNGEKVEIGLISPLQLKTGIDITWNKKLSFSPRLVWLNTQRLNSFAQENPGKRQTLNGYALLNLSFRYQFLPSSAAFLNIYNALNQRYRASNFFADRDNITHVFFGAPQLPIRIQGGLQLTL
ncbi:MAG TPA: hypothetical protein DCS93_25435 [Microscillaceae bacterium]|nr:hypothetical protein [Microscillaceae bacterium]